MSQPLDVRFTTRTRSETVQSGRPLVRVRFLEGRDGNLSAVEVDVPEYWNVSERLSRALFLLRIQTVSKETQRIADRVVYWRRIVEFDGAAINQSRGLDLQADLCSLLGRAPSRRRPQR